MLKKLVINATAKTFCNFLYIMILSSRMYCFVCFPDSLGLLYFVVCIIPEGLGKTMTKISLFCGKMYLHNKVKTFCKKRTPFDILNGVHREI